MWLSCLIKNSHFLEHKFTLFANTKPACQPARPPTRHCLSLEIPDLSSYRHFCVANSIWWLNISWCQLLQVNIQQFEFWCFKLFFNGSKMEMKNQLLSLMIISNLLINVSHARTGWIGSIIMVTELIYKNILPNNW